MQWVRPGSSNRQVLEKLENNSHFHMIFLNLEELDQLDREISVECPVYFHFGWDGSGSENRKNPKVQGKNVLDGMKALEGARKLGCKRFLFSGSQAEYGICADTMGGDQGVPSGFRVWQSEDRLWRKGHGKSTAVESDRRVPDGVCPHPDL